MDYYFTEIFTTEMFANTCSYIFKILDVYLCAKTDRYDIQTFQVRFFIQQEMNKKSLFQFYSVIKG